MEISVIIPVYNREKFLQKCLKSLENQSFKSFEVLIVDDGSNDRSCEIADEFCMRNKDWKIFKLGHKGVSHARLFGINNSSGKYLSFVDSDDVVDPDFLKILYENIRNSQISICNYVTEIIGFNFKFKNLFFHKPGVFSRNQAIKSLISDISLKSFLWNKLFERKLFENIYIPQMCFEDKVMCIQIFANSKKISITSKVLYNYYKNKSSLTWKMDEKVLDDYIESFRFIKKFFCSRNEYKLFRLRYIIFSIHIFFVCIRVLFFDCLMKKRDIRKFFRKIVEKYEKIIF